MMVPVNWVNPLPRDDPWFTTLNDGIEIHVAYRQLLVQSIRYTQHSIKDEFQDGSTLESAIGDLRCGQTRVDEFPTIRVFQRDGLVFSCDNRR
eukprot:3376724-Amphidinium_carterae.1